jgi:glyoxylase-like metal-dependent hydrolase (beta-lactamase superfamily II)
LAELRQDRINLIAEEEPRLLSIHTQPRIGIGQRAFLVRTDGGNVLWDCVPLVDGETVVRVDAIGGLAAIAVSHPHYYTAMVDWSRAFGDAPIYLHRADASWVMRPDERIQFWEGETCPLVAGLSLVRLGGHFDGYQALHWPAGADGRGVLLPGDQPFVCQDRRWVSFMYSYPNLIPLPPTAIRRIAARLAPLEFDRLYGAFDGQFIAAGAKEAVKRSAARYLQAISDEP